jgi:hypothetical protein
VNDDNDDAQSPMKRFENLAKRLFQIPKEVVPEESEEEACEPPPEADEEATD